MNRSNEKSAGISYDRVSTFDQAFNHDGSSKEDGSNEAQQNRCIAFIEHKSRTSGTNLKIIEHLSDRAFSGKDTNRPAYQRMLDLIERRKINFIVTTELSRLSRSVTDFLELVCRCEKNGVELYIIGMDLDTSSPFGRMMLTVLVALAQFERELTGNRVKENVLSRMLKDGRINGAAEILGLVRDMTRKGHFVTDDNGVKVAETICHLYLKHPSKKSVLKAATELGLMAPGDRPLTDTDIDAVLKNAEHRYRGRWPVSATFHKGKAINRDLPECVNLPHGPVITDSKLLDAVQAKIADTKRKHKKSGTNGYTYMLSNLLRYEDGTKFSGHCAKSGEYRYYFAPARKLRIHTKEIDDLVVGQVKEHIGDSKKFQALLAKTVRERGVQLNDIDCRLQLTEEHLNDVTAKETALRTKLIDDKSGFDVSFIAWLSEQVSAVQSRKAALTLERQCLECQKRDLMDTQGVSDLRQLAVSHLDRFGRLTGVQKRNFIEQILESVIVTSNNTVEIRFLGRSGEAGVNERKQSLEYERDGSVSVADYKHDFPPAQPKIIAEFNIIPLFRNESFLRQKYLEEGLSTRQIAALIFSSRSTVSAALKRYAIPLRDADQTQWYRRGQVGYGRRIVNGRVVAHQRELETVERMAALRDQGFSYWKVADILNSMGVPTKSRRAKWQAATVMKILKSTNS